MFPSSVYKFPTRNSATTASLTSVLNIVKTMYPADEHGLVLWSHGTGWLPKGYYKKGPIGVRSLNIEQGEQEDKYAHLVKSFGEEDGLEIDIKELAQAIPYKHSYIIFDACLMGGIEVMYELKDITDYIISSPAEILVGGFPYDKVADAVFKEGKTDLEKIARDYYSYYNSFSGERQSATISLIKTEALANLAAESKLLFNAVADKMGEILPSKLQRYYRMNKHWFYDYGDILNAFKDYADVTKALLALDQVVIYKAATDNFLDISINPDKFYGVSSYFPTQPIDQYLEDYYKELEWNKAVGFVK